MGLPILNRALVLEAPVQVADGAGGFDTVWTPLGTLWAEITAAKGRERRVEGLTLSQVPYKITVRAAPVGAQSRPVPNQRLREGTRVFRIASVAERSSDARYLVCHSIEEVAG